MATTKDKLAFALELGRRTRASVRQCEALMRYSAAIAAHDRKANDVGVSLPEIVKFNRIVRKVTELCGEIGPIHAKVPHGQCPHCKHYGEDCTGRNESMTLAMFSGAALKIRVPDGGEVVVPS